MDHDQMEEFVKLFTLRMQRDYGDLLTETTIDNMVDLAYLTIVMLH